MQHDGDANVKMGGLGGLGVGKETISVPSKVFWGSNILFLEISGRLFALPQKTPRNTKTPLPQKLFLRLNLEEYSNFIENTK